MQPASRKKFGFSLVELMAAAAVMGILVSLALPRYRLFVARSRMSEAKTNLGIIATLQQSYLAEYQKYGKIGPEGMGSNGTPQCDDGAPGEDRENELGFRVTDCSRLRYLYMADSSAGGANANSGINEIYPDCTEESDFWTIDVKRDLSHGSSAIKICHQ